MSEPITEFRLDDDEPRRQLRWRILKAGKSADRRGDRAAGDDAGSLFFYAYRLAQRWRFKRASADQLQDVIIALTGLFIAANALERVETADE